MIALLFVGAILISTTATTATPLFNFTPTSNAFYKGTPNKWRVALTFDDGPSPGRADALVRILNRYHAKATFFVVGQSAAAHPDLIRRIYESGHEIANHSYSHPRLDWLDSTRIDREMRSTSEIIEKITGVKPKYFRPPGGQYDQRVLNIAKQNDMEVAFWDINPGDYSGSGWFPVRGEWSRASTLLTQSEALDSIAERAKAGSIVLLHHGGELTLSALPKMIKKLQDRGFELVTVSELRGE